MRAPGTVGVHIRAEFGPYVANEPTGTNSLFEVSGKHQSVFVILLLMNFRYSVLPAISLDGILTVDIAEGSFTSEKFGQFIDGLLSQMNPYPAPNSVIVMDNARIHKNPEVLQSILDRYVYHLITAPHIQLIGSGMRYEFPPPYLPDYNPIELAFLAIKAHLKRHGALLRVLGQDEDSKIIAVRALHDAVWSVTPDHAQGYFRHCGY
jgi:transposase